MSLRTSLKNLIRRDAEHPSLRERAADLRGDLSGQTRRAIVAGSVAAAVPLPTLAALAPDLTGWLWTGLIERISLDQRSWG
jgi:hypothetical protein